MKCNCGYCGKEINKLPHEIKHSKSGLVFCSKSCACAYNNIHLRSGKNNPNYIDGCYAGSNLYTRLAYRTYKHKCAICGCDDELVLLVHHIDENHKNNNVDNLIILCANDHLKLHRSKLHISEEVKNNRELLNGD